MNYDGRTTYSRLSSEPQRLTLHLGACDNSSRSRCASCTKRVLHRSGTTRFGIKRTCDTYPRCVCGGRESVVHVILNCPDLGNMRREPGRRLGTHSIACQPFWERDNIEEAIWLREPRRWRLSWTLLKHHNGSKLARHVGRNLK